MSITLSPCKTCRFWGVSQRHDNHWRAKCYRYPPQCHPMGGSEWPFTKDNDACGEHQSERED